MSVVYNSCEVITSTDNICKRIVHIIADIIIMSVVWYGQETEIAAKR